MVIAHPLLIAIGLFVVCFLLGSIPFGLIISKVFYHTDIREHGSGNIGTTNAVRTMGKVGGGVTMLLDIGKGVLSGVIALAACGLLTQAGTLGSAGGASLLSASALRGLAFCACIWGHIFSPWLRFHGGKGVAVAAGCMLITFGPALFCLEAVVLLGLAAATKYMSVGSLAAAALCPFIAAWLFLVQSFEPLAWVFCTLGALTILWAHRGNIKRLRAGTENRVSVGKAK